MHGEFFTNPGPRPFKVTFLQYGGSKLWIFELYLSVAGLVNMNIDSLEKKFLYLHQSFLHGTSKIITASRSINLVLFLLIDIEII